MLTSTLGVASIKVSQKIRKDNGVVVSQVAQRFSTWYATFTDLDQALEALAKNKFWIGGQLATVCSILEDSVPVFCYNCHAPGHMYAQCSSKLKRCGKCSAVGHAAFDTNCEYPASKAEWKRASDARKMLPAWAHAWAKRRPNAAQQNPGPASTQKQDEAAKPGKKSRGRPRKNAAAQPKNAAVPGAMDVDTRPQHVDHPMGGLDEGEKDQCNTSKKRAPGRPKNPPKVDASQTSLDGFYKPRNSQA
ncbi:Zinc finger, CCHC retroviral-type [Metarhizium brunneum]